jgi:acetyl esterase/lipase
VIVLIMPLLLLSISLVECDNKPPFSLAVTKDLVYAKAFKRDQPVELMLDVYAPNEAGNWPIVLYLHDFGETREGTTILPQAIAEQGAIVFNIDYPDIDPSVACLNQGKGHRELDEIVACAVRYARASDLGSDTAPLAIAGFSWGGGVASHVALMGETVEQRWEEYAAAQGGPPCQCECKVMQGSTHVEALVGIAGAYEAFVGYDGLYGREFLQEKDPDLWRMLYSSIGENTELKVRLLHSETDSTIPYENSVAFEALLSEAGYDVKLIPFTGGHTIPLEPTVQTIMDVLKQ